MQQRAILATVLAFGFFLAYEALYMSKFRGRDLNATEQNATVQTQSAPAAAQNSVASGDVPVAMAANKTIVTIEGAKFRASIDDLGRVSAFVLKDEKYKDDAGEQINLVDSAFLPLPLEMRFVDSELNGKAFSTAYVAESASAGAGQSVKFSQNLGDLVVTKTLKFDENGGYELDVALSRPAEYVISPGFRPNVVVDGYTVHGAIIEKSDEKLEIIKDGKAKQGETFEGAHISSASDRYYSAMFYDFDKGLNVVMSEDRDENAQIFVQAGGNFATKGYIGPKDHDTLASIEPRLQNVIEYGWFTFIARPMYRVLSFFHGILGNWGWAIVLLTIIIRVILFPLTYKSMVSMAKMRELAPRMKELQEKYKDDKIRLQNEMMTMYREHGANPMSGCLPILVQIPIFFAFYRVLTNAIELKGAPWALWIHDLAAKDPFFVLPILMGILMFVQQKMTPTTFSDPMQEKIMKFLPLIFTFFFLGFPAGLTLYWCVNNGCSVIQQYFINKMFHKKDDASKKDKK